MRAVKSDQSRRYGRLEHYVSRETVSAEGGRLARRRKEKRREKLAEALLRGGDGRTTVKTFWLSSVRRSNGRRARDRYRRRRRLIYSAGRRRWRRTRKEQCPSTSHKRIKFSKKSFPECAQFSPCGGMLATGSADGFIEVWDPYSGKLRKDLKYQARAR